ncbi:glycine/betaine ABC transporter substrate-binding protein [Aerococcus urinaehominis]|uniref:Glycine/betaine ABC transporter substrate-binding protein n=1 Tax=Aerococcus urinaehominis TaxID=128944 RepID=A0A120IB14_9LACT|nr:osmoprotectant ABC transporter substrate-binding protein [Aerococcus urinaehominis]AMB99791.1 glycine/betaine ABC transporter substrate-binding protein [Aerococcus urinaehominis]SDM08847.1 osmoprotectant transport system substrate-binding protein [Aerococcus urinaehominis]
MLRSLKKILVLLLATASLAACSLPGLSSSGNQDGISIASLGTTEAEIMGYINMYMIQHYTNLPVDHITNLGSSSMNHAAFMTGDANLASVRYTGTSLTGELGLPAVTDPDKAYQLVVAGFEEEFDQTWYPSYGFANSYAFMIRRQDAEEKGISKVSDLAPYADQVKVGVDNSWIHRDGDGYANFVETYGFDFPNLYPMTIGLVYTAVASGEVDVVLGYSTDGRIIAEDLVVLEDDRQLFPPYDASPVVTNQVREAHPEIDAIMAKLAGEISNEEMQRLNYTSDNYLLEPATVAREWLLRKNFFEDKAPYLEPVRKELAN